MKKFKLNLKLNKRKTVNNTGHTEVQKEIIKKAKKVIPERVKYYSNIMNLEYGRIAIRLQKTRWGSCSSKKNLNFNALLCLMPEDVMDSIIVHELAHLRYMNHQKEFWNLVYTYFPKAHYEKCRKYLKNEGMELLRKYIIYQ